MPLNRYLLLCLLVLVSCSLSVGSFIFLMNQPQPQIGRGNILQLLEIVIAFGLVVKRADWACTWGMRWFLIKAVGLIFIAVGIIIGGGEIGPWWYGLGFAFFWLGLSAFLYFNQEYFD